MNLPFFSGKKYEQSPPPDFDNAESQESFWVGPMILFTECNKEQTQFSLRRPQNSSRELLEHTLHTLASNYSFKPSRYINNKSDEIVLLEPSQASARPALTYKAFLSMCKIASKGSSIEQRKKMEVPIKRHHMLELWEAHRGHYPYEAHARHIVAAVVRHLEHAADPITLDPKEYDNLLKTVMGTFEERRKNRGAG